MNSVRCLKIGISKLAAFFLVGVCAVAAQSGWSIPPVEPTCIILNQQLHLFSQLSGVQKEEGKSLSEIVDISCDLKSGKCTGSRLNLNFLKTGKIRTLGFMTSFKDMEVTRTTDKVVVVQWGIHTYTYSPGDRTITYDAPYTLLLDGKPEKSKLRMIGKCD